MKTTTILRLLATALLLVAATAFLAACSDSADEDPGAGNDAAEHVDDPAAGDADEHTDGDEHADDEHADEADDHSDGDEHNDGDEHSDGDEHADAVEVAISMTDQLTFEPAEIEVEAGHLVRLVAENVGGTLHDFTIDEMEAHVSHVEGGSEDPDHADDHAAHTEASLHLALDGHAMGTLEFTPEEPGEYVFRCTVPGHAENGMVGTLIVNEE